MQIGSEKNAVDLNGVRVMPAVLGPEEQAAIVADIRQVCAQAPLMRLETARGKKMSVRMTAAGQFGWVSDPRGYRYQGHHPAGMPWPPIPETVLAVWRALSGTERQPECCLVNFYGEGARLGLHQDRDEADLTQPVLSISLGDEGLFRVGGLERGGSTRSVWLRSGDVVVLEGAGRLAYHGVDRIRFGSSRLLPQGGRLNLTLRVVT
ncbi:alpha-ketoglutarate-dependent dioxygenase AlkB [Pseudoruegeria sp. SK021]|uniref:alpha-ketoglutarate-dependent dioxygenase AlkB n=1 Tax=Pseudoruegeria sp. SK021 TaxID=1933035 RepID=UPI000A2475E1|nr:alpha-ketoglutarate-dependent dioxygenase AlkB [Pseudoruegeria sp. SK021]OSP54683.1 alkylated DNA repair dioxygenase [Pseudoruegeria sp. SK021]